MPRPAGGSSGWPAGLGAAERDALAGLLGGIVRDNKVPEVFLEPHDARS